MGPGGLRDILPSADPAQPGAGWDPRILVGLHPPDDAAVVTVGPHGTAVLTADVITPPCDDPFVFGQVAAANALGDVYAMGGNPVAALNLCFFPEDDHVPAAIKRAILEGIHERVSAAGAAVVGGHTVRDVELKVGLSVMGVVDPAFILGKGGLRAGDVLILTKALGVGLIINGYRNEACSHDVVLAALRSQVALNRDAARAAVRFGATGATDITGFGLAGHALEMAQGAGLTLVLDAMALPVHAGALDLADQGISSRGLRDNAADVAPHVTIQGTLPPARHAVVMDPQTSGGLLFGVAPQHAQACLDVLQGQGMAAATVVGRVEPGPGRVTLLGG